MGKTKEEKVEQVLDIAVKAYVGLLPTSPTELPLPDLTMSQFRITVILYLCGPTRMSFIAKTLDVTMATATGIVDRLVDQEIVQRRHDLKDRRVVLCELTDQGRDRLGRTWQSFRNRAREILMEIRESDLAYLGKALVMMLEAGEAFKATKECN